MGHLQKEAIGDCKEEGFGKVYGVSFMVMTKSLVLGFLHDDCEGGSERDIAKGCGDGRCRRFFWS